MDHHIFLCSQITQFLHSPLTPKPLVPFCFYVLCVYVLCLMFCVGFLAHARFTRNRAWRVSMVLHRNSVKLVFISNLRKILLPFSRSSEFYTHIPILTIYKHFCVNVFLISHYALKLVIWVWTRWEFKVLFVAIVFCNRKLFNSHKRVKKPPPPLWQQEGSPQLRTTR